MTALILLGPPGVGKGTQAAWLSRCLEIPTISTGQIFRSNIAEGTQLGQMADSYISRGEFVPDSVTIPMLEARLSAPDTRNGFILDGFPRNLAQAHALRDILAKMGHPVDAVLELTAPTGVLVERMLKRSGEESRVDDSREVFEHRLEVYHDQTEPIATYYADQDLLDAISATGSVPEVGRAMLEALSARGLCPNPHPACDFE